MLMQQRYDQYRAQMSPILGDAVMSFSAFQQTFGPRLEAMKCLELRNSSGAGAVHYSLFDEGTHQLCLVPVYGLCASSGRLLTELFTALSRKLVSQRDTLFQIHCYAGDTETQRRLARLQFGCMAETGLCSTDAFSPPAPGSWTFRTLERDEIRRRWPEIWSMTQAILAHLRSAPVFYPCTEFTEEVYRDFFLDDDVFLHAALDASGALVGMIETNGESYSMLGSHTSANIGEVYVPEPLRGTGLSGSLLAYAADFEKKRGAEYLWVEHGTANPQATGFWGKYFVTDSYEMNRMIPKF